MVTVLLFLLLTTLLIAKIRKIKNTSLIRCVLIAYFLRLGVVIIDLYTDIPVFNSGSDSEFFHEEAMQYMEHGYTSGLDNNYDLFLGIVYKLTDGSRFIGQYLNVLMGVGLILILHRIMRLLCVSYEKQKVIVLLATFMPNLIINSAILLREAWIEFFLLLSLYTFVKWYLGIEGAKAVLKIVICVFLASWMHAGSIFVLLGYFVAFISFNRKVKCVKFSGTTISAIAFMAIVLFVFLTYASVLGGKLAVLTSFDSEFLAQRVEDDTVGGSTYLTWLPMTYSFVDVFFLPIRMVYFLFSPIPFDWRGVNDIAAFLIDSSVYIGLFYRIIKDNTRNKQHKLLGRYLLITVFIVIAVFSVGTSAAGTAMRHRAKIVPFLFVIYSIKYKKKDLYRIRAYE